MQFVGNVEGRDLVSGAADVIVTDGLTGNIALKLMEGVSATMLGAIRDAAMSSARAKLGGALLRGALRGFREEIDPEANGGAYCSGCAAWGRPPRTVHAQRVRAGDRARAPRGARGHRRRRPSGARSGRRAQAPARRPRGDASLPQAQ